MTILERTGIVLSGNPNRVLCRLFIPGEEELIRGTSRAKELIERVVGLTDVQVRSALDTTLRRFESRHADLEHHLDLAHGLRRLLPNIGIVMLSTYVDPRLLGTGTDLPLGGIYLTKQEVADTAILHNALMSASSKPRGVGFAAIGDERIDNLTDSQIEVMRLIAAGFSNAEIARRLVIEEASVEKSVMRLIRQLDVKATHIENQRVMITQAYFALSGTRNVRRA